MSSSLTDITSEEFQRERRSSAGHTPVLPRIPSIVDSIFEYSDDEEDIIRKIDEEDFIRKIDEAFKCGEEIARRLAHAMLIGPPGSGKSSLMDRLLDRGIRTFSTSTDIAESIVTVEVRLSEKQSTFHAAIAIDGKWEEFEFNESLFSHMSLKKTPWYLKPFNLNDLLPLPSFQSDFDLEPATLSPDFDLPPSPQAQPSPPLPPPEADHIPQLTAPKLPNRPPGYMVSHLREKFGSYKKFKKYYEKGFSLYLRDTGGQVEFQEILPLLIFGPSIFLFVFRLDLSFKEKFQLKYRQKDGDFNDYTSSITIEEALLQCLATVDIMRKADKGSIEERDPYVFVVGTHKDKLADKLGAIAVEEEIGKLNLHLDELLERHGFKSLVSYAGNDPKHVMYTVDNLSEDEKDFDAIRSRINAVITSRNEFVIQYPINYLLFCLSLQNVTANVVSLQDFKEQALEFGIAGDEEVSKLLHFLCNRIGIIQHFDKEGSSHIVVNQPPFLYKKVSELVIETFKGKTLRAEERVELEKGILSFKAAESIIGSDSDGITTAELLHLLVQLRIIAPLKDGKYFIPCILNHLPEASADLTSGESLVAPLYIRFGCNYCPKGLFGVLVTYIISLEGAPVTTLDLTFSQDKVSRDQVSFDVQSANDTLDLLSLKVVSCSHLKLTFYPEERDSSQIKDVCITIRQLIEMYLTKSFRDLHYNEEIVKYEMCLKCEGCCEFHNVLSKNKLRCKRKKISIPPKGVYWFGESKAETNASGPPAISLSTLPPQSSVPQQSALSTVKFGEDMSTEQSEIEVKKEVIVMQMRPASKSSSISDSILPESSDLSFMVQKYGLSETAIFTKVSDIHLQQISSSCCKDWRMLYSYLELDKIVFDDVDRKNVGELEKRHDFFIAWREREGSDASYGKLIDALLSMKHKEDAEAICEILKSSIKCKDEEAHLHNTLTLCLIKLQYYIICIPYCTCADRLEFPASAAVSLSRAHLYKTRSHVYFRGIDSTCLY